MCGKATDWAWTLDLPPTTKMVLLALARHIKSAKADRWTCDQRQLDIAAACGLKERQMRTHLHALQAAGLISITTRPGQGEGRKTNIYNLLPADTTPDLDTARTTKKARATGNPLPVAHPQATGNPLPVAPQATGNFRGGNRQFPVGNRQFLEATGNGLPVAPSNERARGREEKTLLGEKTGGQRVFSSEPHARALETAKTLSCPLPDIARNTITTLRPDLDPETTWATFAAYYDGQQHADGEWQRLWKLWILREWKNKKKRSMIAKSDRTLGDFIGARAETDLTTEFEVIHEP